MDVVPESFYELQQSAARRLRVAMPPAETRRSDLVAGLNSAVGAVPDGLAGGVLAGVNPLFGLYASMIGPFVGGLLSSTTLMRVTSTSASALAVGQALSGLSGESLEQSLFLLVLMIGLVQIAAAFLGLARLTKFVSHSVMIGFLTGVALLIILGQIESFTGTDVDAPNRVRAAFEVLRNPAQFDIASTLTGIIALVLAIVLPRTRIGSWGTLVALAIPSVIVVVMGLTSVAQVNDISEIPRGLPQFVMPTLSAFNLNMLVTSLAVAAIILIQGAGVSQSVPNPDGKPSNMARDFIAQGAANVVCGLFQGLPVGGSVNQTALSILVGARSRWSSIFAGLWIAVILLIAPRLVGMVAMPALSGLLILAGYKTIRPQEIMSIWNTGWTSRLAMLITFVTTLFAPIQVAVGVGVALSAILFMNSSATDVTVVQLTEEVQGKVKRTKPPATLPSNKVTVLDVYGSLFYAGARTLEQVLPAVGDATAPVVVLRMHGRATVGATLVDVLARYAGQLQKAGGRLYLSGVDPAMYDQLKRTGKVTAQGPVGVYVATDVVGESTHQAVADAESWLLTSQNASA
jgi:SulP family sulfate permease